MATLPLTEKQERLWRFIASCERSPSLMEMLPIIGATSVNSAARLIDSLERRGYVRRVKNRARAVVAVDGPELKPNLGLFTDADLIAELEQRTKAALARARAINPIRSPRPARKAGGSIFGTWQEQAREASTLLLKAIELAGVHP